MSTMKSKKMKSLFQVEYLKWKMRYKSLKTPVCHFSNAFWKVCKIDLTLNTNISGTA